MNSQINPITLVAKYTLETKILPKHKTLFFAYKNLKYQSWNIIELQNWLSSARHILRRYRDRSIIPTRTDTPVITSHLNYNTHKSYQHIVHRPPNHNHYTVSTIAKFYPIKDPHTIPTSIDIDLHKTDSIPTTSTTTFPYNPSVRNTPSNFSSNFSSPIITYYHIYPKINPTTIYRPKTHNTNSNSINTKLVIDKKKTNKKYRTSSRKRIPTLKREKSPSPIQTTHDLHIPIYTYLPSTTSTMYLPSLSTSTLP